MSDGSVWMEVELNGTGAFESGMMLNCLLEEHLDRAAQITALLSTDEDAEKVVGKLDFGDTITVKLNDGTTAKRTIKCTLVEVTDEVGVDGKSIRIRALDNLIKMKHTYQTKVWEVSPKAIIEGLAGDLGLSATVQGVDTATREIVQNNMSHAAMLRRLADEYHARIVLDGSTLYFGQRLDDTEVKITEDDRVDRVSVRRSVLDVPTKVKVVGYDWKSTQAAVEGTASGSDLLKLSGGTGACDKAQKAFGTVEVVVEATKRLTEGEAKSIAQGILQRHADHFVEGSLTCLGKPEAAPGRKLTLDGFGRIDGTYRISGVEHSVDGARGFRSAISFYSDSWKG